MTGSVTQPDRGHDGFVFDRVNGPRASCRRRRWALGPELFQTIVAVQGAYPEAADRVGVVLHLAAEERPQPRLPGQSRELRIAIVTWIERTCLRQPPKLV